MQNSDKPREKQRKHIRKKVLSSAVREEGGEHSMVPMLSRDTVGADHNAFLSYFQAKKKPY